MSGTIPRRARYLTVAGFATLGLAVIAQLAVQPGVSAADPYTAPLHQSPPIRNSEFPDNENDCPGSPALWGWHFILTGNDASFVSLTVTFQTAGTIVKTSNFGPPSDKHAFVYTSTDDRLLSASAQVVGGDPAKVRLVLSHTCDGGGVAPTESPSPTVSPTVLPTETGTPTPTESVSPTVAPTETGSPTPTESVSPTVAPTETGSPTPTESVSPTVAPTETGTPTPTESVSPTVAPTETGTPTPTESVSPTVAPTETGTPTVAPTETETPTVAPTGTETPTVAPTESGSPTVAPTETAVPSPTVSGTQLTQTPGTSISPSVGGVKQTRGTDVGGNVGGTGGLPTTGTTVPMGLLLLLGFGLVAAGVVTTVAGEPQAVTARGKHRQ